MQVYEIPIGFVVVTVEAVPNDDGGGVRLTIDEAAVSLKAGDFIKLLMALHNASGELSKLYDPISLPEPIIGPVPRGNFQA